MDYVFSWSFSLSFCSEAREKAIYATYSSDIEAGLSDLSRNWSFIMVYNSFLLSQSCSSTYIVTSDSLWLVDCISESRFSMLSNLESTKP